MQYKGTPGDKKPEHQWTGRGQKSRTGKVQQKHRVNRLLVWTLRTLLAAAMVAQQLHKAKEVQHVRA